MNFDNCLYPCNHYPKQDIEYFHPLREFSHAPFQSIPTSFPTKKERYSDIMISITIDQLSYF